jgi:hypothetical protein
VKNEEEILGIFFIYNKNIRTKIVTLVIPEKGTSSTHPILYLRIYYYHIKMKHSKLGENVFLFFLHLQKFWEQEKLSIFMHPGNISTWKTWCKNILTVETRCSITDSKIIQLKRNLRRQTTSPLFFNIATMEERTKLQENLAWIMCILTILSHVYPQNWNFHLEKKRKNGVRVHWS